MTRESQTAAETAAEVASADANEASVIATEPQGADEAAAESGAAAPASAPAAAEPATRRPLASRIIAWVVGLAVTALYTVTVVGAVGNLIMMPQIGTSMGYGITPVGWFWLIFGVALPVVVFAVALLLGRKRAAVQRILLLATGIGLIAAVQLEISVLVPNYWFFG